MNVKTQEGALVNEVTDNSPAKSAGIREDDVIVEFDGRSIEDADDLVRAVRKTDPGTKSAVVVMRGGQRTPLQVEIGKAPGSTGRALSYRDGLLHLRPPSLHRFRFLGRAELDGLELVDLSRQLGEYFQVPDDRGVLVQEVEEGSAAAKAGFSAGDVIVRIGKDRVYDTEDVSWALEDRREGERVDVVVVRKGAQKTLSMEVTGAERRFKFRSEREMTIPDPPDFDFDFNFDFDDPETHHEMRLEKEALNRVLEEVRVRANEAKARIREQTDQLETRIRNQIRVVHTI
jgi:serine protease Do